MSSASQLLYGSVQGRDADVTNITVIDLSEMIIADSPLVYWKMESDGASTETDYSGNGYEANIAEFNVVSPIRGGESTQAAQLVYDTNTYIQDSVAPIPTLVDQTSWTMECVVQVDDLPQVGSLLGFIMGEWEDYLNGVQANSIIFEDTQTGTTSKQIRVRTDLDGASYQLAAQYTSNSPIHIVGTRDGNTLSIYINGILEGQRTDLPATSLPNTVDRRYSVGSLAYTTSYSLDFTGSDFAAYTYALSPERVYQHYLGAQL